MRELTSLEEWHAFLEETNESPQFILKHSTACPISAGAYRRVESYRTKQGAAGPNIVLVKVIEQRDVSNAIAECLEVPHRSPQAILVSQGNAVWTASHHGITEERLREAASLIPDDPD